MKTTGIDAGKYVGGSYISKDDLRDGPLNLVIRDVSDKTFPEKGGRPAQDVLVLHFDDDRTFALSTQINTKILIKGYGRDVKHWIGKPIVIYRDENVSFGSSLTGGNRVRIPQQAATARDIAEEMPIQRGA